MQRAVIPLIGLLPVWLSAAEVERFTALPDGADTESAVGLRLVAHDPLQARQTYQMVEVHQGARWLLYLGHMRGREINPLTTGKIEANGTSVIDVTDPTNPSYLTHIPPTPAPWFGGNPDDATGAQHLQAMNCRTANTAISTCCVTTGLSPRRFSMSATR